MLFLFSFIFISFQLSPSHAGHSKSCIGPDFPSGTPTILPENLCAEFSFRGKRSATNLAYVNITVSYGGKDYARTKVNENDEHPKVMCGPSVAGYSVCLGYATVEISDAWCTVCPQLVLEVGAPYPMSKTQPMPCVSLGDDHEDDVPQIVQGANRFAFDLLATDTMAAGMDTFVSPFNLVNSLVMPCMTAGGNTLRQLLDALHIDKTNIYWAQAFGTLRESLEHSDNFVETKILNRLWLAKSWVPLINPFVTSRYTRFGEIQPMDFAQGPEVETFLINDWVYKNTRGTLANALDSHNLTVNTVALFTSLFYFEANWQAPFLHTETEEFTDDNGDDVTVTMMHMKDADLYTYEDQSVQVIDIPFAGATSRLSFIVIRPASEDEMSTLRIETTLNKATLDGWLSQQAPQHFESFMLPQYTMFNIHDVTDVLRGLGVVDLFDPAKADMKNLTTAGYQVYEDAINRQDYLSVGQNGVQSAAIATDGTGHDRSVQGPIYHADRPFVFIIMDREADLILFVGRVTNPNGWRLSSSIPGGHHPPSGSFGFIFLVVLALSAGYCMAGYIYNSRHSGTHGVENIPHINAMRSCVNHLKANCQHCVNLEEPSEDAMMPADSNANGSYFVPPYRRGAYGHLENDVDEEL